MNLVKRELNDNLKGVLTWLTIISSLIVIIIALHPLAVAKMDMMDEMLAQFPEEMIKAFNLSTISFKNILEYFFYEFQFILVAGSIFAGILSANIMAKEENDKTIQFLYAKPISRIDIISAKIIVVLIYLLIFNLVMFTITAITMTLISDQTINYLLLANIFAGQLIIQITFANLGILIAVLLPKVKAASAIISGFIIVTFILGIISKIADKVANLHYLSFIDYLLNDKFMDLGRMDFKYIIILAIIFIGSVIGAILKYRKKSFII